MEKPYQFYTPTFERPILVQVNYEDGDISFLTAKSIERAEQMYFGRIVAIFKPKQ